MSNNVDIARKVYNTPEGRALLVDHLNDLKFFSGELNTPGDIALHNQSKLLLARLGIWQEHNLRRIVDALMNMPYAQNEGEKE